MIKFVLIGAWACFATLASGYATQYFRTAYAKSEVEQPGAERNEKDEGDRRPENQGRRAEGLYRRSIRLFGQSRRAEKAHRVRRSFGGRRGVSIHFRRRFCRPGEPEKIRFEEADQHGDQECQRPLEERGGDGSGDPRIHVSDHGRGQAAILERAAPQPQLQKFRAFVVHWPRPLATMLPITAQTYFFCAALLFGPAL